MSDASAYHTPLMRPLPRDLPLATPADAKAIQREQYKAKVAAEVLAKKRQAEKAKADEARAKVAKSQAESRAIAQQLTANLWAVPRERWGKQQTKLYNTICKSIPGLAEETNNG